MKEEKKLRLALVGVVVSLFGLVTGIILLHMLWYKTTATPQETIFLIIILIISFISVRLIKNKLEKKV